MSVKVSNMPESSAMPQRSRGRGYFWAGLGVCALGLALVFVQISLHQLFVPWYSPVLATIGAFLLFLSVARRRTIPRIAGLVLVALFAGFQWYAIGILSKLPDYEGPAKVGKQLPAFQATLADGRSFTEANFHDGSRRLLVFFRGRW
jgi:hypothetical protein